jgi:hypothetical protein
LLQAKGYKTVAGRTYWRNSTINFILSNEKYCGDLIMQKTITTDNLTHKRVKDDCIYRLKRATRPMGVEPPVRWKRASRPTGESQSV